MIVVTDASAMYDALLGAPAPRKRLAESKLFAPELIDVEIMNAVRRALQRGEITEERADAALEAYGGTYIVRFPHRSLVQRTWELRDDVTPYDGVYVALAEWLGVPLVTTDARLAGAPGIKAAVEVLPVSA